MSVNTTLSTEKNVYKFFIEAYFRKKVNIENRFVFKMVLFFKVNQKYNLTFFLLVDWNKLVIINIIYWIINKLELWNK